MLIVLKGKSAKPNATSTNASQLLCTISKKALPQTATMKAPAAKIAASTSCPRRPAPPVNEETGADVVPVVEPEAMREGEAVEAVPVSGAEKMVEVAIPLRLVTTPTLTGELVGSGIVVVDDTDKPDTVAEMMTPTVSHNFCANVNASATFRLANVQEKGLRNEPAWSEASHCASM
jgi:hypothetical protein